MKEMGSIASAYFEGGEPFLFYPLMIESIRLAKTMGFDIGVVTNGFWATSVDDALLWLKPLAEIGIADLSVSDDTFHNPDMGESLAGNALKAAQKLGIPYGSICIEPPKIQTGKKWGGQPVVGGDVLFKGRAVDKLIEGLPRRTFADFDECPHEDLKNPGRIHLDPFGFVHVCQGIVIGNIFEKPLKQIMTDYNPDSHSIIGPLINGGPAELADSFGFDTSPGFVDHCHLCFEIRKTLLDKYPEIIAPKHVYGLKDSNPPK
jgi:MoaA/NifB/PqqE/SkfB family radical SAM enzyme